MRIKYKPWAKDYIANNKQLFIDEDIEGETLLKRLQKFKKVEMEVGTGKGQFLMAKAEQNLDTLYIGIEKFPSIIVNVSDKIEEKTNVDGGESVENILLYCGDVMNLSKSSILRGKIDTIYLNFSDPWPKKRHIKRRLTSPKFLEVYDELLKESGRIEQKTDNDGLFDYSIVNIANAKNFKLEEVFVNLHDTDKENVMTEYEKKFSEKGYTIKYLAAKKAKNRE